MDCGATRSHTHHLSPKPGPPPRPRGPNSSEPVPCATSEALFNPPERRGGARATRPHDGTAENRNERCVICHEQGRLTPCGGTWRTLRASPMSSGDPRDRGSSPGLRCCAKHWTTTQQPRCERWWCRRPPDNIQAAMRAAVDANRRDQVSRISHGRCSRSPGPLPPWRGNVAELRAERLRWF